MAAMGCGPPIPYLEKAMMLIDVRFTVAEAITLMRTISAKQWRETDAEKWDDLELLRLRLYETVYHRQLDRISGGGRRVAA
jgi:hypothetical protein